MTDTGLPGPAGSLARFLSAFAVAPVVLLVGCEDPPEIQDPVPLFDQVPIEYPQDLWDEGTEGTTLIRVLVGEEGRVDSVVVVETSGHAAFDSAAVDGSRLLRFEPALREGEPIQVWAQVPVHFNRTEVPDSAGDAGASP